jgi:hypothetical protein
MQHSFACNRRRECCDDFSEWIFLPVAHTTTSTSRAHSRARCMYIASEEKRSAKKGRRRERAKNSFHPLHTCKRQKPKPAYGDDLHLDLVTVSDEAVDCLWPLRLQQHRRSILDSSRVCGLFAREMHECLGSVRQTAMESESGKLIRVSTRASDVLTIFDRRANKAASLCVVG